jgi:7-carboxy-7-deazaguanine synthase
LTTKFPIVEAFGPTIQGEGALAGQVSYFLRTGGCQFRCTWCDSMHAVDPEQIRKNATYMTADQLCRALLDLRGSQHRTRDMPWLTLTGGDPVVWDLAEIVSVLRSSGFRIAVETQGAMWREWLTECDLVTCSPKGPSSGMLDKLDIAVLQRYRARLGNRLVLKVVVFDRADLDFAERMRRLLPDTRLFLSSGTPQVAPEVSDVDAVLEGFRRLVADVLARPSLHDATLAPQMHVLVWGRAQGH